MSTKEPGGTPPKRRRRPRAKPGATYRDSLPPDLLDALDHARSDLDISDEIKLLRVTMLSLVPKLPGSAHAMKEVASVLGRLVYIQARTLGGASDLEQQLIDAADLTLDRLALEDLDGFA